VEYLKKMPGVIDVVPAGSLRRWKETVGDLDILVTCRKGVAVMERFVAFPDVASVVARGETKTTVVLKNGMQTDVRVLERRLRLGPAVFYWFKAHNAIRDRARGWVSISEYGYSGKRTKNGSLERLKKSIRPCAPGFCRGSGKQGEIEAAEKEIA
jgi:DNA polymerase (family 10)